MTYFLLQNFQHLSCFEATAQKKKKRLNEVISKVIQSMIFLLGLMTIKILFKCNCLN